MTRFNPSQHPRNAAGTNTGGQFAAKANSAPEVALPTSVDLDALIRELGSENDRAAHAASTLPEHDREELRELGRDIDDAEQALIQARRARAEAGARILFEEIERRIPGADVVIIEASTNWDAGDEWHPHVRAVLDQNSITRANFDPDNPDLDRPLALELRQRAINMLGTDPDMYEGVCIELDRAFDEETETETRTFALRHPRAH